MGQSLRQRARTYRLAGSEECVDKMPEYLSGPFAEIRRQHACLNRIDLRCFQSKSLIFQ